jgi:hypothetical protein
VDRSSSGSAADTGPQIESDRPAKYRLKKNIENINNFVLDQHLLGA